MDLTNFMSQYLDKISSSATNIRKRAASAFGGGPPPYVDLGPVLKSPLDSKSYKVIQLPNGIKVALVSTCKHETSDPKSINQDADTTFKSKPEPRTTSGSLDLNQSIEMFNRTQLGIKDYNKLGDDLPSPDEQKKSSTSKKNGASSEANECYSSSPSAKSPKLAKCGEGIAAICITVGAGSASDFKGYDGLAHFVEHLVFLGSEKYPEPNYLFTKVYEHKGRLNATTEAENTFFYFSCNSDGFEECVEILVDALTNPLFKQDLVRKEIQAVDSEFEIKQTFDSNRVTDFLHSRARSGHPFGRFSCGNRATLNQPPIRYQAIAFKQKYYLANNMTVCIHAPMRIEQLVKFALEHFSNIPSGNSYYVPPRIELLKHGPPFADHALHTCYYLTPLNHFTSMVISWALPEECWRNYETKPLTYLKLFIENTSPTGLKHFLRKKKWMTEWNNLFVETTDHNSATCFCSLFSITVNLTDEGYTEREEVVKAVFSFLKMLKLGGVRSRFFEEMKRSASTKFHFQNPSNLMENGMDIALRMQYVEPQHILTSRELLTKWDPKVIQNCVEQLKPRTANYIFVSRENIRTSTRKALPGKVCYRNEEFPENFYKELDKMEVYESDFRLPPEGEFLANQILINSEPDGGKLGEIFDSDKLKVTHFDTKTTSKLTRAVPSAKYSIYFSSCIVAGLTTRVKQGVLEYWTKLLRDKLIFKAGHRFDHLFQFSVYVTDDGISLDLEGPRSYLVELLTIFVELVFDCEDQYSLKDDTDIMAELRIDCLRQYRNDTFDVVFLTQDLMKYLLENEHANVFEIQDKLQNTTVEDGSIARFLKTFHRRMLITADLYGTVTADDAQQIVRLLTGQVNPGIQYDNNVIERELTYRGTIITRGTSMLCVKALHPSYTTSIVINYYQVNQWDGPGRGDTWHMLITLYRMMKLRVHNELRTKEQLSYAVIVFPKRYHGSEGLMFIVFSHPHKFTTQHVDERIDNFLRQFLVLFRNEETRSEVRDLGFSRPHVLEEFCRQNLLKSGRNFRKLSVQMEGYTPGTRVPLKLQEKLTSNGDGGGGGRGSRTNDEESLVPLAYLKVADEEGKRNLKKNKVQLIDNLSRFKREMGLLPAE